MAESGLSLKLADFETEVGHYLGYGRTPGNFSAAEDALVTAIIKSGVRRVYFPAAQQGVTAGYEWTWLRPTSLLYLGADGTDGSVSGTTFDSATHTDWTTYGIVAGTDEVTISDGTGPTLGDYAIDTVEAASLTLSSAPGDGTSLTFFVTRDTADYVLPDTFSRIVGNLHYQADDYLSEVVVVPEATIQEARSKNNITGAPYWAAIRAKTSTGSTGQRFEILFYPRPDKAYILSYKYEAYAGPLTDSLPYPLGGMHLSELYLESCLAVAEQRMNDEQGNHNTMFQRLLADAVARDQRREGQMFGCLGNTEELIDNNRGVRFRRGYGDSVFNLTYKGVTI